MNLVKWLKDTSEALRDSLPDNTARIWTDLMRGWLITDDEWGELQAVLVRQHARGPLRFAEIQEAYVDMAERSQLRRNHAQVVNMFKHTD